MVRSLLAICFCLAAFPVMAVEPVIEIKTPQSPPAWALLERELLKTNSAACREFYKRYFDERGWLLCVERWGGDDGPDDAIENLMDWPILHALGGSDDVLKMIQKAWEGHLRQYTLAKTRDVPMARDGMYYKEFPVMFDWLHNGEGLCVFNLQGLSEAHEDAFRRRVRRFAGFYMNEDPGAPNYDPKHKIIKSMFNGSRGPLLRKATALDWAGDPIEVKNRFQLGHGETSYKEMLQHFETYNDIVGDHPLNLVATTLALNAFMLDNEEKYKKWLLEYVDAWLDRMAANNDIIPTNIGLDGKIGGETGGKWYGGVYGWGFTMKMPDGKLVNRNQQFKGMVGFMNAYLLTGNDQYLESWRKQIDAVNAQKKTVDGIVKTPTMFGEQGWYGYVPGLYQMGALDIYHLSMKQADRARVPANQWLDYLEGKNAKYPENYLRHDLERVRQKVQAMRGDTTTPDTRLADDPMKFTPANVNSMIALAMGGLPPGKAGGALFCRLRYFDPENRRSGLPEDTAALIEKMTADQVVVSLANVNQLEQRTVMVQAGGYAEHQFLNATIDGKEIGINGTAVKVRLAPGAGGTLTINMKRYVNPPTLSVPWKR